MFANRLITTQARRFAGVAVVAALYRATQLPELPSSERASIAGRFHFSEALLPGVPGHPIQLVRRVHPSLLRISAWISSVGASVALNDIDGDGLPNDVCYTDPRTDEVIIEPAPGTGSRYSAFALPPIIRPDSATIAPMGCLPGDLNEDGQIDLLVYYWGRPPVAFLRQDPPRYSRALGAASYVAREVVPGRERWYSNAATLADLDGDGHLDLIVGNYFPAGSRILDPKAGGREHMQHSMSRANNGGGLRLMRWEGAVAGAEPDVVFNELHGVLDADIAQGWTLAVGAADLDGDMLPELYLANDFGPDRLLHNRSERGHVRLVSLTGRRTLEMPKSKVLGHDSFKGMGVDFGDLNGDGLLDIVVSNITTSFALEESNFVFLSTGHLGLMRTGVAPYVDQSEELGLSRSGWCWDARLADFDNDGVLELIQATGFIKGAVNRWPQLHELAMSNDNVLSNPQSWMRIQPGDDLSGSEHIPFYVLAAEGRYYDLAEDIGLVRSGTTRGIATADVDGDGKVDFAAATQWGPSYFYHNESSASGAFLGLRLRIPVSSPRESLRSRAAVGAQVTVSLPHGRRLVAQVDGGNGHSGKRSNDLEFGLGHLPATDSVMVDVRWRDPAGRVRRDLRRLPPGWHTIMLGEPTMERE